MKKTKEHVGFPNGLTSWLETHYEMASIIERLRTLPERKQPEIIVEINDTQGTGGFYELAEDWTNEFEILHKGKAWDGEFFEEAERFVEMKLTTYDVPARHMLITLEIREGERTHAVHVLETTKAKNLDFVAQRIAASYYYETDTYRIDNSWYMHGGEISVTVHDWKELKEYEHEVMKQYI